MIVSSAIEKMIAFYQGNLHDINHFLKVWAFAKTIGEQEGLDDQTQLTLELAAVVHDIACPLCREKYGSADGKHQEQESPVLLKPFLSELGIPAADSERISWLVAHHHTYTNVNGLDHRILLEADFLVNADEGRCSPQSIEEFRQQVFRTDAGLRLLKSIYQGGRDA